LRPLEFHRGRPIFYSLGNFIGQNELVAQLPADSYTEFRVPPDQTPSVVFDTRTQLDEKGFPSEGRYWETIVPRLRFAGGTLDSIDIHPVTLDLGHPPQRRGRPRLALGEDGAGILKRFATLCETYGTDSTIEQNVMRVALPSWE
jgi:poly-gamma-glutamate synthesis protein (capsule biosynthesis protein)